MTAPSSLMTFNIVSHCPNETVQIILPCNIPNIMGLFMLSFNVHSVEMIAANYIAPIVAPLKQCCCFRLNLVSPIIIASPILLPLCKYSLAASISPASFPIFQCVKSSRWCSFIFNSVVRCPWVLSNPQLFGLLQSICCPLFVFAVTNAIKHVKSVLVPNLPTLCFLIPFYQSLISPHHINWLFHYDFGCLTGVTIP